MVKEKDCFAEQVKIFYEEMREVSIHNLRKEDNEYNELRKTHITISDKKDIVLEEMTQKDKETIKQYIDEIFKINSIEQQHIYLQGYRDCMKLLKLVKAFHD